MTRVDGAAGMLLDAADAAALFADLDPASNTLSLQHGMASMGTQETATGGRHYMASSSFLRRACQKQPKR